MGDGRPAKRAKRTNEDGTSAAPPRGPSITIPIPVTNRPPPSHRPTYVPGSGPPSGKIRLMPETDDSTGYIVDKLVLPAGPIDDPTVQRRMYYIVSWTDIPLARVAVDCSKALEYLTPRCIEDWEYEDCLRREREKQEAALEAIKNAPVRKKPGRPPKNRILADADKVQAEEEALRSSQPSASGPSLSSPQKVRATGLVSRDVGDGENDRLDSDGEAVEYYDEEDMDVDDDEDEDEDEDDLLQQVLLEQAQRNARADELDDDYNDYDQLADGRTVVRLDDAPVSQQLPARAVKSQLASGYASTPIPASVAPSPSATASAKKQDGGTGRGPGARSLPPPEVAARARARQQQEPAAASSSAKALPQLRYAMDDTDDGDNALSASAPARSPSPKYTGKGKQPVYAARDEESNRTNKGKEPARPISQTPIPLPSYVSAPSLSNKNVTPTNEARGKGGPAASLLATEAPPELSIDGETFYEIERLEGVQFKDIDGVGSLFFLVRWKGDWGEGENPTWEPEENLEPSLVKRFLRARRKAAEESGGVMPPSAIPASQHVRAATSKAARSSSVAVAVEAGRSASSNLGNSNTSVATPTTSLAQPGDIRPRESQTPGPTRRDATIFEYFPIANGPPQDHKVPVANGPSQDDEGDDNMEDDNSEDAFDVEDSDKDDSKERRRLAGLANGSYQPPMGVHLPKPVLPKAVRESLPSIRPRTSRR
ncbi:hypothetical protein MAPG_03526 [Magnaporthiopsis poae ATCC 64411]|uniref:Chromo domain-containing protein n=1 Tax=Magnaporthiopsis poae (strain ATCC 64411 / 73-15) TaxID=644358 RepID=A0A0C4DU89_MAGP6|nr:hypothetical protein MAPG_03526 [Magnaporthiopsis poae ATCC 64411]